MNALFDLAVLLANYQQARCSIRFGSRAALLQHQDRALEKFRERVLRRSPFYAPMAHRPLDEMPVMSKALMLAEFDKINTRGISRDDAFALAEAGEQSRDFTPMIGDVSVGLSTGTSGQRGLFLASRRERMRWAGMMLGRMLRGSLLQRHRIAFLLRANNQLYEAVSGKGRIRFQFFDLKRPLAELAPDLVAFAPTTLIAPAQVLRELATLKSAAENTGNAGAAALRPTQVISVAESLFDDDRIAIETAFGMPTEQIYQATEGFLAYTCPAGRLHLNETFLHIEPDWIDEAAGLFHPVITDFSRETQPIVRYRLDDVLRLDRSPCACGSPELAIARIEGRADDILELPSIAANGMVRLLPDFVARAIAGAGDKSNPGASVQEFRVCQTGPRMLQIALQAPDLTIASAAVTQALHTLFREHGIAPPELAFSPLEAANPLQKRRRVIRVEPERNRDSSKLPAQARALT